MHKPHRLPTEIPESLLAPTGATMKKDGAKFLNALGNHYRFIIVNELMSGEKNVSALNMVVKVSQPSLSQHLAKLRRAGIVKGRREQRQIFYYLSEPNVVRIIGIVNEMAA